MEIVILTLLLLGVTDTKQIAGENKKIREHSGGWLEGDYVLPDNSTTIHVDGDEVTLRVFKWLESEDGGRNRMIWSSGPSEKTVRIAMNSTGHFRPKGEVINIFGHISDDKKNIRINGTSTVIRWITPDEAAAINNLRKDPVAAPPGDYVVQPENQGKLVWLSGPPGAGKSTIAALMSKMAGYVYYEADAFFKGVNPYLPVDGGEPSEMIDTQPNLFGKGMNKRGQLVSKGFPHLKAKLSGSNIFNQDAINEFYIAMAEDIVKAW